MTKREAAKETPTIQRTMMRNKTHGKKTVMARKDRKVTPIILKRVTPMSNKQHLTRVQMLSRR